MTYVWFDALINYLSGLGWPSDPMFREFWPVAEHVVAKDILKPHAIYWPTMLHAMGLEPFWRLHVHGYWNVLNRFAAVNSEIRQRCCLKSYRCFRLSCIVS